MENTVPTPAPINPAQVTVQDLFTNILHQRLSSGVIEERIVSAVDSLIDKTISDTLSSYSELGKAIREQLTSCLMPNMATADFPKYNEFVLQRLRFAAKTFYDERLTEMLDKEVQEIFSEIPKEVTLTWLLDKYKEYLSKEEFDEDRSGSIRLKIITDDGYFTKIAFDAGRRSSRSMSSRDEFTYTFGISHTSNRLIRDKGDIYTASFEGVNTKDHLVMDRNYGFTKLFYNLYASKTILTLDQGTDPSDYDLEFNFEGEECDD